jgi:hypothetical protein
MAEMNQGRWTAQVEGDFVVFVIGARIQASHPLRSLRDLGGFGSGLTGIWHETHLVYAGDCAPTYGTTPPFDLGKATDVVGVGADATSPRRLRRRAG